MFLQIENVLPPEQVEAIRAQIAAHPEDFEDGQASAGWHTKSVKHNEQAKGTTAQAVRTVVEKTLLDHPVFMAAANPKLFVKTLVSRYRAGMSYGTHVDNALMGGVRTDLSFTLFLAPPETYDGGELVVEGNDGETSVKLPAGSLVLYPTTTLHRVAEVTCGERLAFVGWVRSFIRSHEDREILFDIENLVAAMRLSGADRAMIDRLLKVRANLIRKWAED